MAESVREFTKKYARFDFSDIFGIGRLRELAYQMKMQEINYDAEMTRLREINDSQAKAVTVMVCQLSETEERNRDLSNYIRAADEAKKNLMEKKMMAESRQTALENELEKTKSKLDELRDIKSSYDQLSKEYELLMMKLKESNPDISPEELEVKE